MLINLILLLMLITCTVTANLLVKTGANHSLTTKHKILGLCNSRILIGLTSFTAAAIIMVFLLKRLPLNLVQALASLQYIAITLSAYFILQEPINKTRWLGVFMIAVGIIIVGKTVA